MTNYIVKEIKIKKHKYQLEIYPPREGCNGTEGPYYEIFPLDYEASLYAFSNKEKINQLIKKEHLSEDNNIGTTGNGKDHDTIKSSR
jgi:hypothetical protein